MADETLTFKTHPGRVEGPNEEWQILDGDWRDGDRVLRLQGIRVQSNDLDWQESHKSSEPDWTAGFYGVDEHGRQVDLLEIFKRACVEGRVLDGAIIVHDRQRHGR